MLKKTTLALTAAGAVAGSCIAMAGTTVDTAIGQFEVSANATLASEYIFRGISQTKGDPAIQGGLDVVHESGLYVGIWASNVDFEFSDAPVEYNYYAGYGGNITETLAFDVGWLKYDYPGDDLKDADLNYSEFYGNLSAYGFKVGINYSDDVSSDNNVVYTYIGYERGLPYGMGLAMRFGKYDFKDDTFFKDGATKGEDSYFDWYLALTKEYLGLQFGLAYTQTDLKNEECKNFVGNDTYCNANFVVSVSKTL
ncbi:TorF family putative porin [Azotobacter armeniacus]